jgi:hypothetical protein
VTPSALEKVSDSPVSVTRVLLYFLVDQFPWLTCLPTCDPALPSHLDSAHSEGSQAVTAKQEVMANSKNPNSDEGEKKQNMSSQKPTCYWNRPFLTEQALLRSDPE